VVNRNITAKNWKNKTEGLFYSMTGVVPIPAEKKNLRKNLRAFMTVPGFPKPWKKLSPYFWKKGTICITPI